jgi:hypothetical protein
VIGVGFAWLCAGEAQAQPFKVAQWNIRSGHGKDAISAAGANNNVFVMGPDCTTNAWGVGVVQQELMNNIKNDPGVIALVLNEAYGPTSGCAFIHRMRDYPDRPGIREDILGWAADTGDMEGVGIIAKFGFAGPPQLGSLTGSSTIRYIWKAPVCVNQACTASIDVYGTHLDSVALQGQQVLNFMANSRTANRPHIVLGDFNTRVEVSNCGSLDAGGIDMFVNAGYRDAWAEKNASGTGYTSTVNNWCNGPPGHWAGVPAGAAYKRIDFGLPWGAVTTNSSRLWAVVKPGDDSPSDHYGLMVELQLGSSPPADTVPPTVQFTAPANGATVASSTTVSVSASDDRAVTSVDLKRDGTVIKTWTSSPYTMSWDTTTVANGTHTLEAVARDAAGNMASTFVTVTVSNTASGFWTATVNTTATGATLQKTSGCGTCLDAGGISAAQIASGDGSIQFSTTGLYRLYAGLGTDRTSSTDVSRIQFAFSLWESGGWEIRESNVYKIEGTYLAGDMFKVAVVGGVVKYYKNDVVVYTSTVAPTYPLGLDATFLTMNGSISNASLVVAGGGGGVPVASDVVWVNNINTSATGSTLEKITGCSTCPDAGAVSQQEIAAGDGSVEFTASTTHRFYVGLGTDRSTSTDRARINYSFSFWTDGTWDIRENDTYRTGGTNQPGDVFKIAITSGIVKYYRNNTLVYTSTVPPAYPLGVDTTMFNIGSRVSTARIVR